MQEESLGGFEFALEDVPAKMILVDQNTNEGENLIVYHSGTYFKFKVFYRGPICCTKVDHRCRKETL